MAEWLGRALQKLPHQFDSGRDLLNIKTYKAFKPYRSFRFELIVFSMKYSQTLGVAACVALIINCFFPWSYVAEIHLPISGIHGGENLGKPGLFNIIICIVMSLFFLIPKIWAKRANMVLGAINIAWSIRNYLLVGTCSGGICPEKRAGIFILLFLSFFIEVMTFIPDIKIVQKQVE